MNDPYGNHEFSLSTFLSDKDVLTRHKWPEEKPVRETDDEYKHYLIRLDDGNAEWYQTSSYFDEGFGYIEKYITHWWNLPEVMECI